jgi:hypothetical protein
MLLHGLARFNAWQPEGFKQQLLAAATARLQQGLQPSQANTAVSSSSSSRGNQQQAFQAQQLPVVLLSLTQLQISLPTPLLQQCEALLLPQLQDLPLQQLTVCLFAMGRARHSPSAAFLDAAMACVDATLQQHSGAQNVAQLLYGLAAMGGVREQLMLQPQQQQRVARLLARLQQVRLLGLEGRPKQSCMRYCRCARRAEKRIYICSFNMCCCPARLTLWQLPRDASAAIHTKELNVQRLLQHQLLAFQTSLSLQ